MCYTKKLNAIFEIFDHAVCLIESFPYKDGKGFPTFFISNPLRENLSVHFVFLRSQLLKV